MDRVLMAALALTVLAVNLAGGQGLPAIVPADPNATAETRNLLAGLQAIRGQQIIFGQHNTAQDYITTPPAGETYWSDVKAVTGEWPGMWSFQMNFAVKWPHGDRMRDHIRFAYEQGAPITMCWHMDNPVTGGNSGDTNIDIGSILPGGANHHLLVDKLSLGADYLQTLTDAQGRPVPILYRPWHEFNLRSSFWWNNATPEQFVELYRFTVEYFRDTRGLNNLLYVYNPNWRLPMSQGDIAANFMEAYPGDQYVDVLSIDYYGDPRREGVLEVLREIVHLADAHGKLPAFHEGGVNHTAGFALQGADPDYFAHLLEVIEGDPIARQLAYFTTWYNRPNQFWVPYGEDVLGYNAFMEFYNSPYTAFGDDVRAMNLYVPEPTTLSLLGMGLLLLGRQGRR